VGTIVVEYGSGSSSLQERTSQNKHVLMNFNFIS